MFGLLSGPYGLLIKGAAIVLAAVALFGFGYYKGHTNAVNAQKAQIVNHVLIQTKYLPQETKVLTETVTKIRTVHDKVYVDVVKTIPDSRACDVPAAGVSLLNANRGTLPAAR